MVDASVVADAVGNGDVRGALARARLMADPELHAPHVLDLEVTSVLRRWVLSRRLEPRRATKAISHLSALPIERYPHAPLLVRAWELRANVTPYDASYVALAERLGCPLLTTDRKLSRVRGLRCQVELLAD